MQSSLRRLPIFIGFALSVSCLSAQIVPGQLPDGPPAQPGQLKQEPKAAKPAAAQTPGQKTAADDDKEVATFKGAVQTVLVPTSVLDPDGHGYLNGLQASEFEVLDNDKPQKVQAEITELPMSVVLAIQANSDVEPLLPKIKKAGILLHGLVTGDDGDVAVLSFDHEMHHLLDFTHDADKIDDAMQKLRSGSSTAAMIDAVTEADRMLERHDPTGARRRVILLMSRNVDKGSQMHMSEAVRQMQFHNVIVYCINISKVLTAVMKQDEYPRSPNGNIPPEGLPPVVGGTGPRSGTTAIQQGLGTNALNAVPPVYKGLRDLFKKTPAEAFTTLTGGRTYSFATQRALEDAVADIGKDLNSQYILSYAPSDDVKSDPGFHTIRVLVNRPGLIVRARTGYWWGGGKIQ